MSFEKLRHLSISEFAELCHSSRKTLIYYDNIGLLKPLERNAQGYRYYSSVQATQFQLIQLLQSASYSLDEIKQVLSKPYLYEDLSILVDKYNNLLEERKKLDTYISQFSTLISMTKDKQEHFYSKPTLIYRDTSVSYFATIFPYSIHDYDKQFYIQLQKHSSQILNKPDISPYPLCMIIDVSCFPKETQMFFGMCHQYTDDTPHLEEDHTYTLSAGHYITCSCSGMLEDISKMLLSMYHFALQNRYTITGNFFSIGSTFNFNSTENSGSCTAFLPVALESK